MNIQGCIKIGEDAGNVSWHHGMSRCVKKVRIGMSTGHEYPTD